MESMPNINHSIKAIQVDIVNLNDKVGTHEKNNLNKLINKLTKKSLDYELRNHVGIRQQGDGEQNIHKIGITE